MGGGVVCHVFVSQIIVPQVPWERRLLVEIMVFPTDPPPGAQGGAAILVNGGWAVHNLDFHVIRAPCSCEENVLGA